MLRFKFINNIKPTLTADYLVVWTDFLDACTYFHPVRIPFFFGVSLHLKRESYGSCFLAKHDSLLNIVMICGR